ncbi:MAG: DUF3093 family protein [Actinomycetota bacterium]
MREIVRWPWWLSFLIFGLDFSIVIAIWAGLGNGAAIFATLVTLALTFFFYIFTSLSISANGEILTVGRAHIDKQYLGDAKVLTRDEMTSALREGFNPSAYYAIRFWIKSGIKIEIEDSRDPTPFWIVTCKKTAELEKWVNA